jgi:ornithine cyclodeaminase/alanine dehydrogenase-like protein (mu-crystallin family)
MTLLLSRRDVAALMDAGAWLDAAEAGFRALGEGRAQAPPPMAIDGRGGAFHAKGARLALDRLYVALKLNGNFPANPETRRLPTIQGAILLCDGETGALLAILDSIEVTLRRTAAATALAARFLARPDSATILICGCGAQGAAQLEALRAVLPLRRGFAWDRDAARARAFADAHGLEAIADPAAAGVCDVIVACTTAKSPYLGPAAVRSGSFVAAVGADSPEKSEVAPELMRAALVVADILPQCAAMGDLRHALAAGAMRAADVHAELHELVAGTKPGRTSADQITLFDSTGTAVQDVAAAALIYERACRSSGFATVELAA